ncbi:DUF3784 domain-containing protein [Gracilibacillus massiliensis]|uniref:DUF3784 domain-containing protein n=1 Tax=Gracilibacillus massiliensis TaxID=1564956 RepID=UPI00071C6F52|nr:DUF3784 domain-containing protein [Gracilibacillus massiliensis]
MDTGTIIFAIVMGWTLIIYGGITFLVVKKEETSLISGFANRPKEEQEYLKQSGFIKALGKLLTFTFYLLAITFILGLLQIPYGFEIGIAVCMIVLMGGMTWIQRYEVAHKRKKNYWIMGSVSVITLAFIASITFYGYIDNEIKVTNDQLIITGIYGEEIPFADIQNVEKTNHLPEVRAKTNGFAMTNKRKGKFRVEGYEETVTLFITGDTKPYLIVETQEQTIIFNRDSEDEIEQLYQQLQNEQRL